MLRRRESLVPTGRGLLLLLGLLLVAGFLVLHRTHPFLAVSRPISADLLIVEGWSPDRTLEESITEFRRQGYRQILVTGGPIEQGSYLFRYQTLAELGVATLKQLGLQTNLVAVPAPDTRRDRTYISALAARDWLRAHHQLPARINVLSTGAHARRTWDLFQLAFGNEAEVGIIAVPDAGYDATRWWTSSQGFRMTIDELIAYLYAVLLFRTQAGSVPPG